MALAPGTRLGPYEVTAQIGEGGMGVVYRATDTNLSRQVAIKVLPEVFAQDADRLARFEREAKTLASLNHPNIAQIHGLERSAGTIALVMELVEGPTLAERIARGAIPIDEALPIAKQIADALEAAHEQGIIHRDLKPANIKVRPDGTVKVLDFGLAKAMEPASALRASAGQTLSQAPTITPPAMTQAGIILGTAAYMSPEQARGTGVDRRTDLWAFGAALYEMLAGRRLFDGATVSDTLARVLMNEPDWTALPVNTPIAVRRLLRRCLEKKRRQRLESAADARLEIEDALAAPAAEVLNAANSPALIRSSAKLSRTQLALAAVGFLLAAIASVGFWGANTGGTPPDPLTRFEVTPREGVVLGPPLAQHALAWSPDGRQLVYVANGTLYRRELDEVDAAPVRGIDTSSWVRGPFYSPDGRWIGFFQEGRLRRVPAEGGAVVDVCEASSPFGAVWGSDGRIVYGQGGRGIWSVPAVGGEPMLLVAPQGGELLHGPQPLPGGEWLLFTTLPEDEVEGGWDAAVIAVESLRTKERRVILRGTDARYLSSGHLVYVSGRTVFGVTFDVAALATDGTPVPIVEDVLVSDTLTGAAQFVVSTQGALAYVRGDRDSRIVVLVNRSGVEEAQVTPEPGTYSLPRVAPDGRRVIVGGREFRILDTVNGDMAPLTVDASFRGGTSVVWAPDGRSIAVRLDNRLVVKSLSAGEPARLLADAETGNVMSAQGFTPDGLSIVFTHRGERGSIDVSLVSVTDPNSIRRLLHTRFNELAAEISPDGRWIAYQSDESGRHQVYVRPFPDVGRDRWLVSTGEGRTPLWSRNGRELFYLAPGNQLMATPVIDQAGGFTSGRPVRLFEARYYGGFLGGTAADNGRHYDVMPDGRFIMLKELSAESGSIRLIVVQRWIEELKRLVPTN